MHPKLYVLVFVLGVAFAGESRAEGLLQTILDRGYVNIGYRTAAPPFSYRNEIGEPAGYTVDLCRAVIARIGRRFDRFLTARYVPVTAANRFQAVNSDHVDLLCGATTETISRRKLVAFSSHTFITGASVIFRADGPAGFVALTGKKVGVTRGTTTEQDLLVTLKKLKIAAQVALVSSHREGMAALASGAIDAYFGDRAILMTLLAGAKQSLVKLRLSQRYFSVEPYALAVPRGQSQLLDEVDRALSRIFRSGEVTKIYRRTFGNLEPSTFMKSLLVISAVPE